MPMSGHEEQVRRPTQRTLPGAVPVLIKGKRRQTYYNWRCPVKGCRFTTGHSLFWTQRKAAHVKFQHPFDRVPVARGINAVLVKITKKNKGQVTWRCPDDACGLGLLEPPNSDPARRLRKRHVREMHPNLPRNAGLLGVNRQGTLHHARCVAAIRNSARVRQIAASQAGIAAHHSLMKFRLPYGARMGRTDFFCRQCGRMGHSMAYFHPRPCVRIASDNKSCASHLRAKAKLQEHLQTLGEGEEKRILSEVISHMYLAPPASHVKKHKQHKVQWPTELVSSSPLYNFRKAVMCSDCGHIAYSSYHLGKKCCRRPLVGSDGAWRREQWEAKARQAVRLQPELKRFVEGLLGEMACVKAEEEPAKEVEVKVVTLGSVHAKRILGQELQQGRANSSKAIAARGSTCGSAAGFSVSQQQ